MTSRVRSPRCVVIVGPMGSGKSAEALKWARRHATVERVLFVSSSLDTRAAGEKVESRAGCSAPALKVRHLAEVRERYPGRYEWADAIVVDEAQFFYLLDDAGTDRPRSADVLSFVTRCLDDGKDVVVAGLDSDAMQQPFLPLAELACLATEFTKLTALCELCRDGTEAAYTIDVHGGACKDAPRVGNGGYCAVCYRHMREHHASLDARHASH
jgi:thymidine kinase